MPYPNRAQRRIQETRGAQHYLSWGVDPLGCRLPGAGEPSSTRHAGSVRRTWRLKDVNIVADVSKVSPILQVANESGQHPRPQRHRRRAASRGDLNLVAEPLAAAATPNGAPKAPSTPLTFMPDSVVDITLPGQMTYDPDGRPNGMTAPRIYRMTAGPSGANARWLTLREQSA